MKPFLSLFAILILLSFSSQAQKNIIVTIGDKKIDKEEFEQVYRKNNTQLNDESEVKTPSEYMDLFVDYKLKVIEAENRGFDTITAFIDELAGYRKELAKPYLTDVTIKDSIVKQAYYRKFHERRASHILLRVDKNASDEDKQVVYDKAIDIRNQFINNEKSFTDLAKEFSEDPSAAQNGGDLGFFRAFSMVTEFEDGAYQTPVGEVSMPVLTQFGYHLIHVTDTLTITGEMNVAHIMKIFPRNVSPDVVESYKNEMDSVYTALQNGADWNEMVEKHSDDRSTKSKNGVFRWISKGFNVKEFADAAFELKGNDQFTKPIKSQFGWHIIKRIDFREPATFEEEEEELTRKIKSDPVRSKHNKELFIAKLKKEYGFEAYEGNIASMTSYFKDLENDTITNIPNDIKQMGIYQIGDSIYTVASFVNHQKKKHKGILLKQNILNSFDTYEDECVTLYESAKLNEKYPEFKQIMREYHDGMLLFSIMEQEVWNKAVEDSTGLETYYQANQNKYFWEKCYDGMIIRCYSQEAHDSCKALIAAGFETADTLHALLNTGEKKMVKITQGKWEEGSNKRIDYLIFGSAKPDDLVINDFDFVHGEIIEAGVAKTLDEARGLYISDYQKVLEDEWMEKLRSKYRVKVNKRTLKKVESIK